MDRRDDELLSKQLRTISPPSDGPRGLALVAVFVTGLAIGAYLFAPQGERPAPHDVMAAISALNGAPPTLQR